MPTVVKKHPGELSYIVVILPALGLLLLLLLCHHPLNANLGGFRAVVTEVHLFEPLVVESFLSGNAASRVIDKDLSKQIPEVLHEGVVLGNHVLFTN